MIHLLGKIPARFFLAVSGGLDSMSALDFFKRGRKNFVVVHFDHDTSYGKEARKFVRAQCRKQKIPLIINRIDRARSRKESPEEYWRNERYRFFYSLPGPVVTAHHLDDATEWWIFSSLHGQSKVMPYSNRNVIRPFLLTPKQELESWAYRKGVGYLNDPSNQDERYMRSIVRHQLTGPSLRVNPGLRTVVKKKILEAED